MAAHVGGLATGFVIGLFLIERSSSSMSSSVSDKVLPAPGSEPRPESNWRVPVAAALGLALIVVPMVALPKPDDYLAEYKRFAAMEEKTLSVFDASMEQWQAGQINGQQYADVLEKQILPPWRAEREALEKLNVGSDQAARKRLLVEYMTDREQGWQLTVEGLRTDDTDKLVLAAQKTAEAENVAARLRGR
jgi:hypothetical protein